MLEQRHQVQLSRIIQQNLTNDSPKVYLMPVLQQILSDENLKFLRVYINKNLKLSMLSLILFIMGIPVKYIVITGQLIPPSLPRN